MSKRVIIVLLFICSYSLLSAQLTYGTTGLLHAPSAMMQRDKTVMIGGNFLNKEITPKTWSYHTYNYYLNATIFPFLEITYVCTLLKFEFPQWNLPKKFRNQDRHFGARLRILEEGKYYPAVVIGTSDPFSRETKVINSEIGNGYFCRFFLATSKQINIVNEERIGVHLSYLYNRRKDYHLNGLAFGLTYSPVKVKELTFIAEYDSKDIAVGANYLLFNRVNFLVELQRFKYFSGGLTYKIHLK